MKSDAPLLEIGTITKPHGLRGELKVHLFFAEGRSLWEVSEVVLQSPFGARHTHTVTAVRGTAKEPILALEGVTDRDGAEAVRGSSIWVQREELPELEPGEYYLIDVVGCEVFVGPQCIGTVKEVRPDPSVDTLVIRLTDGTMADQPLLDAWVGLVDVTAKRVELLSEDGLIQ